MTQSLGQVVHPSWLNTLDGQQENLSQLGEFLRAESRSGRSWAPPGDRILRAFEQPMDAVKVVIVGQDPYPTKGHAIGWSFSVAEDVKPIPRSLTNIFRELSEDIGTSSPSSGDLAAWVNQGVLLLNRVLTVQVGKPGSHRDQGWEQFTAAALAGLVERDVVAVLWGKDAQVAGRGFDAANVVASAHPSPMSADRGFYGSRPFSRANQILRKLNREPIDWTLR